MFPEELHHQLVVQIYHSLGARLRQQAHKLLHQRKLMKLNILQSNFQNTLKINIKTDLEDEGEVEGVLVDAALDVLEPPVHRVLLGRLLRRETELRYLSQRLVASKRVCKDGMGSVLSSKILEDTQSPSKKCSKVA